MFPTASLLATLLLVISVAASPVDVRSSGVTLPFAKRINTSGGKVNIVQQDQLRAAALKKQGVAVTGQHKRTSVGGIESSNATNQVVSYIASIGFGTPPTSYNLIVDSGSSNTWIGADKPYKPTSTSHKTGDTVAVSYGSASFAGDEWLDTVTITPALVCLMMTFGVANETTGYNSGVDGVVGLGPTGLTLGTLTNKPGAVLPTITDNIYGTAADAPLEIVAVSFAPPTSGNDLNGELTFGGTDSSKYTGDVVYAPITSTAPASSFWGIDLSIAYGTKTILSQTAGIVDTGTALILIASDAYDAYKTATGGMEDEATGLLKLTTSQYENLQNLHFIVYSQTYALTPNGQIWPRALNSYIGGSSGSIYSVVNSIGTPSGQGFDFINGQAFVERFYSVFDTVNWQVGFATTSYTNATTN